MTKGIPRLLIPAAAMAVLALPAAAAGPEPVPVRPVVVPPAPVTDWSGPYGGLTFGAALGESEAELGDFSGDLIELDVANDLFPEEIDASETGLIGGATLGYNVQRDNAVGGVEFDLSLLDRDVEADYSRVDPGPFFPGVDTNTTYRTEISGLATLRLRGGFARDRDLFYATAGVAAGHVENEFALALPQLDYTSPDWSNSETLYGYVLGGGYERRLGDRVSLKGEVLYYDLEDVTVEARDPETFPGQAIDYEFNNDGWVARIGINFAF